MFADEYLGSHHLNSFAALLEENFHTSSQSSNVVIAQAKKLAEGKISMNGGKKVETNTAFVIPEDRYDEYCTRDEQPYGNKTKEKCKKRIQKIQRICAKE